MNFTKNVDKLGVFGGMGGISRNNSKSKKNKVYYNLNGFKMFKKKGNGVLSNFEKEMEQLKKK